MTAGSGHGERRNGIVATKVRVPTPRLDAVPRPRLLDRLDDDRARVALVSAPAGSGKTVLVLDWLRRADRRVAWLSVDALDNDPARFFAHLAAALEAVDDPGLRQAATLLAELARHGGEPGTELLNAFDAADAGTVVVLDDIHEIDSPVIRSLIEKLTTGLRRGPRLVLLTRVDPPFALSRLRISGELIELRQRDLRFTEAEAVALFERLLPDGLDGALIARLRERTEGWAAGLRMAAAALDRVDDPAAVVDAFTGSHELMVDYLLEEVLDRQDEALQRFLLETSVLGRFTAETCAEVTGDPEAPRHLATINDADLFLISLDGRGRWYRYHHLFAELLEYRLRRLHPDRGEELYQRAARWFERHGDVQEALRLAGRAEDPDLLVELLDRHGYPILARSEFGTFARWFREVPDPLEQRHPMFLVAVGWFQAQTRRAPDLDGLLAAIDRAIDQPPPGYPPDRLAEARLQRQALRAFTLRILERFEESIEAGAEVLDQLPDDATQVRGVIEFNMGAAYLRLADMPRSREYLERGYENSLRAGTEYLVLASLGHLGSVTAQTEGVAAARQQLESAMEFAADQGLDGVPAFGIVLYQLAGVHGLAGEHERGRAPLERAVELTGNERETDIHANVLIHLARIERHAGNLDRAEALLTEAAALAHGHNVKPFATTFDVERARLRQAMTGELQHPTSAPPSRERGDRWSTPVEAETLLQLQHCLALGLDDDAGALAGRLRTESEPRGRSVALCVARLAEAAVAEEADRRWAAFGAGLGLAARHGYVQPILDGGEPFRRLLEAGLAATSLPTPVRAFGRTLLEGFGTRQKHGTGPAPPTPADEAVDLTDREHDVLRLLATGLTNEALADELFVSVNTVKTHLKRIYAKLDVGTRTEAVQRAVRLGLADLDES